MFAGNVAVWFEIPVADMARAVAFYQSVFAIEMPISGSPEMRMAIFPHPPAGDDCRESVGGCLIACNEVRPSADGSAVYLDGGEDLAGPLARVEAAGGKVIVPKTKIPDYPGYFANFLDSEGNRVGLYSLN